MRSRLRVLFCLGVFISSKFLFMMAYADFAQVKSLGQVTCEGPVIETSLRGGERSSWAIIRLKGYQATWYLNNFEGWNISDDPQFVRIENMGSIFKPTGVEFIYDRLNKTLDFQYKYTVDVFAGPRYVKGFMENCIEEIRKY